MSGKILIVDSIATNRIVLQVKLATLSYDVLTARSADEALLVAQDCAPDLVLAEVGGPHGSGTYLCQRLKEDASTAHIPVILILHDDGNAEKVAALQAGADDFLCKPVDEDILLARLRSLLRTRDTSEGLKLREETSRALGFAEESSGFDHGARIALVAADALTAQRWSADLGPGFPATLDILTEEQTLGSFANRPIPDVFVISAELGGGQRGLTLLSELRSRPETRHSACIMVIPDHARHLGPMALDLGATDLMSTDFCGQELDLRLRAQIRRKQQGDRLRHGIRDGLIAAVTDPLTGLHNRRYALSHLASIVEGSAHSGREFAVLMIDVDRFKSVNDTYGHPAGDDVLRAIAERLQDNLRSVDLVARVGGEEFLVLLPDTRLLEATGAAKRLCRVISQTPIPIGDGAQALTITISIGLTMGGQNGCITPAPDLLVQADRALYTAKTEGRNQVTIAQAA